MQVKTTLFCVRLKIFTGNGCIHAKIVISSGWFWSVDSGCFLSWWAPMAMQKVELKDLYSGRLSVIALTCWQVKFLWTFFISLLRLRWHEPQTKITMDNNLMITMLETSRRFWKDVAKFPLDVDESGSKIHPEFIQKDFSRSSIRDYFWNSFRDIY